MTQEIGGVSSLMEITEFALPLFPIEFSTMQPRQTLCVYGSYAPGRRVICGAPEPGFAFWFNEELSEAARPSPRPL
jgi:hypothetical protein